MSSCRRVTSAMPTAPGGYSALRYKPNAVPLFGWSVLARFQFGVIPLALLLLLSTERHSYAEDGAVTAGYALSAGLLGPVRSRCADRYGHGRLLVVFAGLNAAGLIVLAVLASAPWPLLLVVAIFAGCLPPPVGPVMRSAWRVLADGEPRLRAAYSLDAVSEEVLFVVAPLVAAARVARWSASAV